MTAPDSSLAAQIAALYIDLDRRLRDVHAATVGETATAITTVAVDVIPGVEQASISEGRNGTFRTLAATGDVAARGDDIQYELGSGPCVDAILRDTVFRTGDLAHDPRWPEFGARAHTETGVSSMLSFRLFFEHDTLNDAGSQRERLTGLNLYSTQPDAFDDTAQITGTVMAAHSAQTLLAATARDKAANLERALLSSREIGMAMGVLMATHKVSRDDAFALLRVASQNSNQRLFDIARDVTDTGTLDLPPTLTGPALRRQRPLGEATDDRAR